MCEKVIPRKCVGISFLQASPILGFLVFRLLLLVAKVGPLSGKDPQLIVVADTDYFPRLFGQSTGVLRKYPLGYLRASLCIGTATRSSLGLVAARCICQLVLLAEPKCAQYDLGPISCCSCYTSSYFLKNFAAVIAKALLCRQWSKGIEIHIL